MQSGAGSRGMVRKGRGGFGVGSGSNSGSGSAASGGAVWAGGRVERRGGGSEVAGGWSGGGTGALGWWSVYKRMQIITVEAMLSPLRFGPGQGRGRMASVRIGILADHSDCSCWDLRWNPVDKEVCT